MDLEARISIAATMIRETAEVWLSCIFINPANRRVRFQYCRDNGNRGMDHLVTVLFTDEYFLRTKQSVPMWLRSWRSKHGSTGDCSLRKGIFPTGK
ncbi:hypothetical protein TNCV_4719572 [Trichonephila clavipes]|uniref:Uncharacterized protein n=1 Tax=Trichonephila clavipes TaxID=2585209 RepID=A0A8X6W613_TRICX|nr:hypothetical protein TNCV_4719572 [Trichonephila clavipes]